MRTALLVFLFLLLLPFRTLAQGPAISYPAGDYVVRQLPADVTIEQGSGFITFRWKVAAPAPTPPAPAPSPTPPTPPAPVTPPRIVGDLYVVPLPGDKATPAQLALAQSESLVNEVKRLDSRARWVPFNPSDVAVASWVAYAEKYKIALPSLFLITKNGADESVLSWVAPYPADPAAALETITQVRTKKGAH